MRVFLVHRNFLGQYLHLARHLGTQAGSEIVFLTLRKDGGLYGVNKMVYAPKRKAARQTHHYLREAEAGVLNGQESRLRTSGLPEELRKQSKCRLPFLSPLTNHYDPNQPSD
jgi:hypothetical protein